MARTKNTSVADNPDNDLNTGFADNNEDDWSGENEVESSDETIKLQDGAGITDGPAAEFTEEFSGQDELDAFGNDESSANDLHGENEQSADAQPAVGEQPSVEEPKPKRTRRKTATEAETPVEAKKGRKQEASILTIEAGSDSEEEDPEDAIWHEIHNAYRTRKMLTGKLGMVERLENGNTIAVAFYKDMRVIIPLSEMMINLITSEDADYGDLQERQNKILSNMIGAEIDFMVKGINSKTRSVVASRKDAMLRKRKMFYLDTDRTGKPKITVDRIAEARIVAISEKVARVEIFGLETSIYVRNLSWDWVGDVRDKFSVGDQLIVRITDVRGTNENDLAVSAEAKSVTEDRSRIALEKCKLQGKYAGTVQDIRKGVAYVRLAGGINAVAHSCNDKRTLGKKDDVCFVVTKIDLERNVAVGIVTRIIKQNL